jgi:hypothetical protein
VLNEVTMEAVLGLAFVRYADDIAIFAVSERAAGRILESVMAWLEKRTSGWKSSGRRAARGQAAEAVC